MDFFRDEGQFLPRLEIGAADGTVLSCHIFGKVISPAGMLCKQTVDGMLRYLHSLVQMHSMPGAIVEVFEELGQVLAGCISNLFLSV